MTNIFMLFSLYSIPVGVIKSGVTRREVHIVQAQNRG